MVEYDEMAPGPVDPSVLYLQAQHRTNNIDMMEVQDQLICYYFYKMLVITIIAFICHYLSTWG